jgi:enoyl-CoA hydratase
VTVRIDKQGSVWTIIHDRPEARNAMDPKGADALTAAFLEFDANEDAAVAGAQGYTEARIFCQRFEAELIAIAGTHLTFDDIPRDKVGKPAQIHLQNGVIVVSPL